MSVGGKLFTSGLYTSNTNTFCKPDDVLDFNYELLILRIDQGKQRILINKHYILIDFSIWTREFKCEMGILYYDFICVDMFAHIFSIYKN